MFEDAVLALLDADERHFAELSQVFIKHCYEKSKKFPCCLGRHRHQN